jgi:ABC-type phosphate transport system auxiliary subunit
MGFFSKTAEEKEEKILKDGRCAQWRGCADLPEQKADDKHLRQALKDVEKANKAELKAAKDEHNANEVSVRVALQADLQDLQKAIRKVDKLVADMNKLQHGESAASSC